MHHLRRCCLDRRLGAALAGVNALHSGRALGSKWRKPEELAHTTILVQDGCEINELPVIVRKVNDLISFDARTELPSKEEEATKEDSDVDTEALDALERCHSLKSVYALLELLPKSQVTPNTAAFALKRIIELEKSQPHSAAGGNFTRQAVLSELVEMVVAGRDEWAVVEALRAVNGEEALRRRLQTELLVRASENQLGVGALCAAVRLLGPEDADALWVGFAGRAAQLDEAGCVEVLRVLPLLNRSRTAVFQLLERKLLSSWWHLPPSRPLVGETLALLGAARLAPPRLLAALAAWTNLNVHLLRPEHLSAIVAGFTALDFTDNALLVALERFAKANIKKTRPQPRIETQAHLYANMMAHAFRFNHRSEALLESGAAFLVRNGSSLTPMQLLRFAEAFGRLNYEPRASEPFWRSLERHLDSKFGKLRPAEALDALLACVYLQKHPLNFVARVFNPHFLDRLSEQALAQPHPQAALLLTRAKLHTLDAAFTLECPNAYQGPLLPRWASRPIWQDGRVRSMSFALREAAGSVAGLGAEAKAGVATSVLLPELPCVDLFVVDVLLGGRERRQDNVALLVHVPEHYSRAGGPGSSGKGKRQLLGPQVLRARLLRLLGLRVVHLEYETLCRLRLHPTALKQHLERALQLSQPSSK